MQEIARRDRLAPGTPATPDDAVQEPSPDSGPAAPAPQGELPADSGPPAEGEPPDESEPGLAPDDQNQLQRELEAPPPG